MHIQKIIMGNNKGNRVRFNHNVAVHDIIHWADFTENEIMDTWYTDEETVHVLEQSLRFCINECMENVRSSTSRNHRQKPIKKAVLNVLNEQERQKVFGYDDVHKIALVNAKTSGQAISKALGLGLMDYEYVEKNVICECNDNEKQIIASTKQMLADPNKMESSITENPAFIINGIKRPECHDFENTLEINDCFQYELELTSNTKDLTKWSVSLSVAQ